MTLNVRDFRNNLASSLDKAMAGEQVLVRRGSQLFTIVPINEDELAATPELEAKIEKARQEHRDGTTLKFKSAAEAQQWLDNL